MCIQSSQLHAAGGAACTRCGEAMRLARVDTYPMPQAPVEIVTLKCNGCGTTLQRVQASNAIPGMLR